MSEAQSPASVPEWFLEAIEIGIPPKNKETNKQDKEDITKVSS
jgi:hypothetical protein